MFVALLGATIAFRRFQLPITKYGAVNLLGIVATGGALAGGPSTTAAALFAGLLACDTLLLGKSAWMSRGSTRDASRSRCSRRTDSTRGPRPASTRRIPSATSAEFIPAMTLFFLVHFVLSRGLLYFSLLVRGKLLPGRALAPPALRGADVRRGRRRPWPCSSAPCSCVGVASSAVVALVLCFGGLLFKRIIEESIAAEELNTILAMEQVVSSDRRPRRCDRPHRVAGAPPRGLAHRCASRAWTASRQLVIYRARRGAAAPPEPAEPDGATLRALALDGAEPVIVPDAVQRFARRRSARRTCARSWRCACGSATA